ncbi:MAG: zinc-binding dehydrogenase [Anaeromyxobacter sp.]
MKAIQIKAFGGPEVFEAVEAPDPAPGPGQLLVRVLATSVNPVDYKIRHAGSWAQVKPPAIIGYDAAGTVEALGPGVAGFSKGDPVFYTPRIFGRQGTYAELHVVDADIVAPKPPNLTYLEAASLPLAGCTAWDAIVRLAQVRPGEDVLVHAGAGGVGSIAVQLAHAAGARVLATAKAANHALVRGLGADEVVDYTAEDFAKAAVRFTRGKGLDVAFDTVGGDLLSRTVPAMKPYGRMTGCVSCTGDLSGAVGKNLTVHFEFLERAKVKIDALAALAERGQVRAVIDAVLPLDRVADAHRKIEAGGMRGKLVLEVAKGADRR